MMIQGFIKVAAGLPQSIHKMHLKIDSRKALPGYSKRRVSDMLRRRMKK